MIKLRRSSDLIEKCAKQAQKMVAAAGIEEGQDLLRYNELIITK